MEVDQVRAQAADTSGQRLDSWKAIANHLGREVRTVQRWEKDQGLPVHRITNKKSGTVYAYTSEVDAWLKSRRPLPVEGWLWGGRLRRTVPWLVIATVTMVAVAGMWWMGHGGTAQPMVMRQLTVDPGLTFEPALSPDGKFVAYSSDRDGDENLDLWLQQVPHGRAMRVTRHAGADYEPAFSPDGQRLVFRSDRDGGGIYSIATFGGDLRKVTSGGRRPRYSPNGKWVAYWDQPEGATEPVIYIAPAKGGPPKALLPEGYRGAWPVWTPDSEHLLFCGSRPGEIPVDLDWWVVSLSGELTKVGAVNVFRRHGLLPTGKVTSYFLPETWLHGTDEVLFAARLGDSRNLWKVGISQETWQVEHPPERLTSGPGAEAHASTSWGDRVVFSNLTESSDIWSLPIEPNTGAVSGHAVRLTHNSAADLCPSVSADGEKMVFESNRTGERLVWAKDLRTGEEWKLTGTGSYESLPQISADGSRVAYLMQGEGRPSEMYVVPFAGGTPKKICEGCGVPWQWSPDGESVVYLCKQPRPVHLGVVNVKTGQTSDLERHSRYDLYGGQLSADGRWVAAHPPLFLAPVRGGAAAPQSEWIRLSSGAERAGNARWSPDGKLLYFRSDRDGFFCIWAQPLDARTRRPVGPPFAVYHSHVASQSLMNIDDPESVSFSVAGKRLVFAMGEIKGNIWMAEVEKR